MGKAHRRGSLAAMSEQNVLGIGMFDQVLWGEVLANFPKEPSLSEIIKVFPT